MRHITTLLFSLFLCTRLIGQSDSTKSVKSPNRLKIIGLPVVSYSPDTKLAGGAGGLLTFNFKSDSIGARRSSVIVGAVYTQLNQLLLYFPFQLFPKNQAYWISGEVGYFRYVFNFFGTGNETHPIYIEKYKAIPKYIEKYSATFPRLRLNFAKKIQPNLFLGVRYAFDDFTFTKKDSTAILIQNKLTGSNGGRVSGVGIQTNYDSRDLLFFPTKGWVGEAFVYTEGSYSGSNFSYQRLSADVSHYIKLGENVVALNAVAVLSNGDVPFHQMPVIGGTKRMRGYFEGKYRDNNLLIVQGEYRFPLYKRFGGVAFGGLGQVSDKFENIASSPIRYNFGAGLRFTLDVAQHINIRADYGIGYKSSGFYLTVGEAF
jgi:outer membrane protein assembly factor BamA